LKRYFYLILFLISCELQEESFTFEQGARITFSEDTITFDTLLASRGSITKRLRVFNENDNAINIDRLSLAKGASSAYKIIVSGREGHDFQNVSVLGQDSLLILVEVLIDPMDKDLPFLVKDSIIFESNNNQDMVRLISWGQDANFLDKQILPCNITWTANRPYVLLDTVLVDSLCTLTIEAGTNVFLDQNASIFVQGTIKVMGEPDNQVVIRNTRFDENFDRAPGQWGGIFLLQGSSGNQINHALIKNGTIGLRVGTPDDDTEFDLRVSNTIIQNMAEAGILAFTSDIQVLNTQINNAGQFLVGNFAGGNYTYTHCTFTNNPSDLLQTSPSVQFSDNFPLANNELLVSALNVQMINSIIWGNEFEELLINLDGGTDSDLIFDYNIIKGLANDIFPESNTFSQQRNFPLFVNEFAFDYRLDSLSPAVNSGLATSILTDLTGLERDSIPDIGAYEWLPGQN